MDVDERGPSKVENARREKNGGLTVSRRVEGTGRGACRLSRTLVFSVCSYGR